MNIEEIFESIVNGLTNNASEDLKYLKEKNIEYLNHENSVEISKFIGRLTLDIVSSKDNIAGDELKERCEKINNLFEQAKNLVNENKLPEAKKIMDEVVSIIPNKVNGGKVDFSFASAVELSLFVHTFNPKGKINHTMTDNSSIYMLYGYLLAQSKDIEGAINSLEEALKWNPVNVQALLELAEINRLRSNEEVFKNLISNALKLSLYSDEIARCYYMLGLFYKDKKDYEASRAFLLMSNSYCENVIVMNELNELNNKFGINIVDVDSLSIKKEFEKKNIQYGPSENAIKSIEVAAKEAKNGNLETLYKYCEKLYFDLTSEELNY